MKHGFFSLTLLSALSLTLALHAVLADPWPTTPDWTPDDAELTMSVALADLDNDGDLDLVAGNYNYPYYYTGGPYQIQSDSIGGYWVGYEWTGSDFDVPRELSETARCIDCIDIACGQGSGRPAGRWC